MNLIFRGIALTTVCLSIVCASAMPTTTKPTTAFDSINTITTAVPFLRINNDTRGAGMGDVGIAMSPDANGARLNGAKMGFLDKDYGVGISFTPWLKGIASDIYLFDLSGYYRIKNVQAIHASLRYFSLGDIQLTDENGFSLGTAKPSELAFDLGYSRRLSKVVSVGATLRFIYSNLSTKFAQGTQSISPGMAGSGDISVMVDKIWDKKPHAMRHEFMYGLNISNIGSKITYTASTTKDFIPTNLGMGFGYKLHADPKDVHTVAIYLDLNKLMVPTPIPYDVYDSTKNGIDLHLIKQQYWQDRTVDASGKPVPDFRAKGVISGMFGSFGDAPGGALEELREITTQVGAEYFYKNIFGVRAGYFYEHPSKGGRQFLTVGATVHYSIATIHMSYLVPTTTQKTPLDNTFRFSLSFDFAKGQFKKKTEPGAEGAAPPPADMKVEKEKFKRSKKNSTAPSDVSPDEKVEPKKE